VYGWIKPGISEYDNIGFKNWTERSDSELEIKFFEFKYKKKSWKGIFFYTHRTAMRNKYFKWRVISYLFKIKFVDVNTILIGKEETIWCITSLTVSAAFNLNTKIDFRGTVTVSGTGEEKQGFGCSS